MSKPLNPWHLPEFKAGQNLTCRIEQQERDGYAVTIEKDDLPGFLPTDEPLRIGDEVLAQFVCVSNNRILLATRFTNISTERRPVPYVRWEDKLHELDKEHDTTQQADPSLTATEVHRSDALTEEEAAFSVWAGQIAPQKVPLRRATDLLLPPINPADQQTFSIAEHDLEWLVTYLEGGMRSGCLKASSENVRSRSGILLYRGRCVGCIYTSNQVIESPGQEEALQCALADLRLPDTKVTLYDLPQNLVLASAALFLGYPVENRENLMSRAYFDYTLHWLAEKKHTACLAIALSKRLGHCFAHVYRGQYIGSFNVEDQTLAKEKTSVYAILDDDPQAVVNVLILPAELTSTAVRFGFNLSMAGHRI